MQMDYKVKELQNSVQQKMDERMSGVQNRYGAHALESVIWSQTQTFAYFLTEYNPDIIVIT